MLITSDKFSVLVGDLRDFDDMMVVMLVMVMTGSISHKLRSIFSFTIPPITAKVALMYFMAKSCLHIVINFILEPEPGQNMPYLFAYHWPVPNSAKFKIPGKHRNSAEMGKLCSSAQNSTFHLIPWSLITKTSS